MKRVVILIVILLFVCSTVYAAGGDLAVNGNLTVDGTVNGNKISPTPGPNTVPASGSDGKLDKGFMNVAPGLDFSDELLVTGNTEYVSLDLGTVTVGDRIYCSSLVEASTGVTFYSYSPRLYQGSGTATMVWDTGETVLRNERYIASKTWYIIKLSGMLKVTGSGTLTLTSRGFSSTTTNNIYCIYLKKQ